MGKRKATEEALDDLKRKRYKKGWGMRPRDKSSGVIVVIVVVF